MIFKRVPKTPAGSTELKEITVASKSGVHLYSISDLGVPLRLRLILPTARTTAIQGILPFHLTDSKATTAEINPKLEDAPLVRTS